MEVKSEKPVTWAAAKKVLEKKEGDKELGYEQKNALEFLRKFSKLSEKKAEELAEELSQISKLKDRHTVAIIDMLPSTMDELRLLFANEIISPTEDDCKKILSIVKKFT